MEYETALILHYLVSFLGLAAGIGIIYAIKHRKRTAEIIEKFMSRFDIEEDKK